MSSPPPAAMVNEFSKGRGVASNPGTAIQRHVTGVHSSKQSLDKGSDPLAPEGKARTKHVGEDVPIGVYLGADRRRARAEAIGRVAAKVGNEPQVTIRVDGEGRAAAR